MSSIDINFDVYSDTPKGKDPDSFSSTLRNYHKLLWSKSLPNKKKFYLDIDIPKLLHHQSKVGEFFLSSDSIGHTGSRVKKMSHIIKEIKPEEINHFFSICSTIGAYIIFPAKRIDKKMTISLEFPEIELLDYLGMRFEAEPTLTSLDLLFLRYFFPFIVSSSSGLTQLFSKSL